MVISEFCIRSDGHHHIRIHLHNCTFLLGLCIGSLLRNRSGDVRGDDHIHKRLLHNRSGGVRGDDHIHKRLLHNRSGGVRGDDHIHKRLLHNRSGGVRGDDHIHKSLLHNRSGDDVRDGGDRDHSIHILPPLLQGVLLHWAYF